MTNTILLKRSSAANAVPAVGNLTVGELALNYTDGNLFFKTGAGTVALIASTQVVSVTGNIVGGNVLTGGLISAAGNITGTNLSGTITTASQLNITAVGTLGILSVTFKIFL